MLDKAIEKIQKEIEKGEGNVKKIGKFILDYLADHPGDAEEILNNNKSIRGSIAAIEAEVKKLAINGCAMVEDEEVYRLALKYYGINEELSEIVKCMKKERSTSEQKPAIESKEKKPFGLNLEDLF